MRRYWFQIPIIIHVLCRCVKVFNRFHVERIIWKLILVFISLINRVNPLESIEMEEKIREREKETINFPWAAIELQIQVRNWSDNDNKWFVCKRNNHMDLHIENKYTVTAHWTFKSSNKILDFVFKTSSKD